MTVVAFACGHGGADASVRLRRPCPVCMLIAETHRSRGELLSRVVPPQRAALANETRIGAVYTWRCGRGHDRYEASIREALTGTGCRKCRANAAGPSARREAGVPFMNPGLRTRTSMTEQRLRVLLGERIRLQHRVNAVHIARPFFGRREVWPDIVIPELRVAVEYDSPGRGGGSHRGLKAASDQEKDDALREVGWEVVRIRSGGLEPLGPYSVQCRGLTIAAVDEVVTILRRIRGDAAVDALLVDASAGAGAADSAA